eukprot:1000659-Amphidinium_carterae.1
MSPQAACMVAEALTEWYMDCGTCKKAGVDGVANCTVVEDGIDESSTSIDGVDNSTYQDGVAIASSCRQWMWQQQEMNGNMKRRTMIVTVSADDVIVDSGASHVLLNEAKMTSEDRAGARGIVIRLATNKK